MMTATAPRSTHRSREIAAIRAYAALGCTPRNSCAHITTIGSGADIWQVVRHDRRGSTIVGSASVSYTSGGAS